MASENDEKHMGKNERKYEMKTKRMLNYIIYIHIYYVHVFLIRAESWGTHQVEWNVGEILDKFFMLYHFK